MKWDAAKVAFLLDHQVEIPKASLKPEMTIKSLCASIDKGSQGLTEALIYRSYDAKGLPVYGGGSGRPRFKANKSLK